ncbi:MAG: hypothetical protein JW841_00215 [Deltaproteobacteria bacterium]|nr:hypothetical protein [Deltaproteobacteria bacterium]
MSSKSSTRAKVAVLADNPLEGEQLLLDALFGPPPVAPKRPQAVRRTIQSKPQHYRIMSISMYTDDIERLEQMVAELKRRGNYKANKSQLIRHALTKVNLDEVPEEF